ncbi:MAG: RagB/SusD family nutrient uptake outer membrane protein [Spirosomataceae bacterium]
MRILKQWLAVCFICLSTTSCRDSFLQLAPVSNPNAGNFFKTKADFDLASNAAYATLYTIYNPEGAVSYMGELMGDNVTILNISGNMADKWQFRDYTLAPANTMVYQFWQDFYKSLYNINIVISKVENADVDAAYKDKIKGEMMFLRALYYFNMVQIWGDLPLVTAPITAEESYGVLRTPISEVYTQVIKDLQFAASKLPLAASAGVGKASKGAAQSLLGKVYLTMGDKSNAAIQLKEVVNSGQYQLLPSYATLWDPKNKNTKESIFEIQFLGGSSTAPFSDYYLGFFPNSNALGFYGSGMNQVVDDVWNEYEKGDTRRVASIDTGFTDAKGVFTKVKFPKKWQDKTAPIIGQRIAANNNFMVLRYADVLLLLTEATGDPQYLNLVRKRAGLPEYGTATYPSTLYKTIELATEHERRMELAFEFQRWFDLKRTNRVLTVLTSKGKAITQTKLVIPIPNVVRDQNNKITQNAGY